VLVLNRHLDSDHRHSQRAMAEARANEKPQIFTEVKRVPGVADGPGF
jgi:hypothetical protein